jgi:hypothetical protein
VGDDGQQLLPPALSAAVHVTAETRLSAPKPPASLLRCHHLRRTCRHPGRRKHLLPRCRYVSARLRTAAHRAPPQPVGLLGWFGRPYCLQAPLILSIHVQQLMVAAPALVLLLAQLVPDPVPPPALLVLALALWYAAAQTQLAQAIFSHQLKPHCWWQLSELLILKKFPVSCGTTGLPNLSDQPHRASLGLDLAQHLAAPLQYRQACPPSSMEMSMPLRLPQVS